MSAHPPWTESHSHSQSRTPPSVSALIRPTPIIPPRAQLVPDHQDTVPAVEQILIGLDRFAYRLDQENKALSHQLHLISQQQHEQLQQQQLQKQQQDSCPRCNCPSISPPQPQPHQSPSTRSDSPKPHPPISAAQHQPAPSSPSPDSSFDLVSADDRWDSHANPPPAAESSESPSTTHTRKDSLSISRLPPATPKSPALNAADASFSLKTMPTGPPTNTSALGALLSTSPQPARPPHSPVPSSTLASSPLQSLCQDLTRLIWTSTRPLMILDQHQEIEQSADANGTAGAETSMKTKDKAVMTLEEEEIADPVPDVGDEPTAEQVAAVLKAAEERLLRLSDMFQQALHDRDILQNHLNSYYHHMAIDRCIRRDAIRNTGGPSNAASANNAANSGDKTRPPGGGGVGGAPASPPPLIMDPPMSPLGATSFRVGSYGAGSMGFGRGSGGAGGHDFSGIGGIDSMGGRYIGSAMGRGAEPDAMMQFMHMDDLEI